MRTTFLILCLINQQLILCYVGNMLSKILPCWLKKSIEFLGRMMAFFSLWVTENLSLEKYIIKDHFWIGICQCLYFPRRKDNIKMTWRKKINHTIYIFARKIYRMMIKFLKANLLMMIIKLNHKCKKFHKWKIMRIKTNQNIKRQSMPTVNILKK